jgi:hypothetical protein
MAGKIGKGIAGIVGLGQEAYHHNKAKKEAATGNDTDLSGDPPSGIEIEEDEDDWIAGDAQQQLFPEQTHEKKESTEQIVEWFKQRHPSATTATTADRSTASTSHHPSEAPRHEISRIC